jgi:hypothetical protein
MSPTGIMGDGVRSEPADSPDSLEGTAQTSSAGFSWKVETKGW